MFGFSKKRRNPEVSTPDEPAAVSAPEPAPAMEADRNGAAAPAADAPTTPIFVARQPIFDRQSQVTGYELLFRSGRENRFTGTDVEAATAISIEQSTAAFGLDELVGERLAWVNLSRGALLSGLYELLPRERTVIELLENVAPDREVMEACRRLKATGYRLALDDFTDAAASQPLLEVADLVKVDFRLAAARSDAAWLGRLRERGIGLLAEKVETLEEHRLAAGAGYELFQGYYFCKPEIVELRDLPPSKLSQLRFLSEVSREDASFERLEELFRQDVGLTIRLLRYLNSAAFGWRHEVKSLRHALALMGLRPLRKWATMMGLVALGDGRPRELTITALARARFAEQLAPPSGLIEHEAELFLSGMLSVADAMIGRPIREVLAGLAVPAAVHTALIDGNNAIGSVLRMVTAYERGDWRAVDAARRGSNVRDRDLSEAYVGSLRWAGSTALW